MTLPDEALAAAASGAMPGCALHVWRHPRAIGAEGRCIGRTDLPVDPRRAKRLAHRIRALARRQGLPAIVITSPLQRSLAVGRWLARWGWLHRVDPALSELDFGAWDGQRWADIPQAAVDAWCAAFPAHGPGGGECVAALLERVAAFDPGAARLIVTHGGWLSAARWLALHGNRHPTAQRWPAPLNHAACVQLDWPLSHGAVAKGGQEGAATPFNTPPSRRKTRVARDRTKAGS
jgi:alpha-ribazole phosphatase